MLAGAGSHLHERSDGVNAHGLLLHMPRNHQQTGNASARIRNMREEQDFGPTLATRLSTAGGMSTRRSIWAMYVTTLHGWPCTLSRWMIEE